MAKCRNCKKEIDANATRGPYCLTEMPTSDFISKLKGAFIALSLLGIFALAMYYFVITLIPKIGMILGFCLLVLLMMGALFAGVAAIGLFTNAKKWSNEDKINSGGNYILFGLVCSLISLALFVVVFILAKSVFSNI